MSAVISLLVGVLAGGLTGAGVGGGTLLLLYMSALTDMPGQIARSTNLLYYLTCAPPALYSHIKHRRIDIKNASVAALLGTVCSAVAAYYSSGNTQFVQDAAAVLFIAVGASELLCKKGK